jgi:hypothetical protein
VAIEFDPDGGLVSGTPVEIAVVKAKAIPADIGTIADDPYVLSTKLQMRDVTVAMGKVVAL